MDRTREKLTKFSEMVLKEAEQKKKDIIAQAENEYRERIDSGEILFLKKAYERIQEAVRKIDKDINEEVSKAILESKQALFNRRDEIMDSVFQNVREKLAAFRKQDGYKAYLINCIGQGISEVGAGEIRVAADAEDIPLIEEIRTNGGADYTVMESDDQLLGGCLVVNRTKGFVSDYSFTRRLNQERAAFLENYELSIG